MFLLLVVEEEFMHCIGLLTYAMHEHPWHLSIAYLLLQ